MTKSFESFGVRPELVAALAKRGITHPFAIQALTLSDALEGHDVCGKAKTGSGKTIAFGLPVLQTVGKAKPNRPVAICLVPTRELASQVRDELEYLANEIDRTVGAVFGGENIEKQITMLNNGIDLMVCTPGRAIDLIERKALFVNDLTHIIIDEADRMADMGFLPQVEWILRNVDGTPQTLLFSATLDGVVDGLIQRYQHDPKRHEVVSETITVDQMQHRFIMVHQMDAVKVAAKIANANSRTLIFCATKHGTDKVAAKLNELDVHAAAIHGDLRQNHRERALAKFTEGKLEALVATDVAARGIHIDDVNVVIHFDPPQDHKTYLHRSGRTARAGTSGVVVTFVLWDQELEVKRLQKRIGIDIPLVEMFSNDDRLTNLAAWNPTRP